MDKHIVKDAVKLTLPSSTNPEHYLKTEEGDSFICSICFYPQLEILFCNEPCSKLFCKICFAKCGHEAHSRYCQRKKVTCAYRKNPQFFCPSNNIDCNVTLISEQQFQKHCVNCQYIKQEVKSQFKAKRNYQCFNGHQLNFQLSKEICYLCNNYHYSSKCLICQIYLCTRCRIIPCTKTKCPKGHNLVQAMPSNFITCDLCCITVRKFNNKIIYSDRQCDFDACQSCYSMLVDQCQTKYIIGPQYGNDDELEDMQEQYGQEDQQEDEQDEESQEEQGEQDEQQNQDH